VLCIVTWEDIPWVPYCNKHLRLKIQALCRTNAQKNTFFFLYTPVRRDAITIQHETSSDTWAEKRAA
jgi:hypothetical protein